MSYQFLKEITLDPTKHKVTDHMRHFVQGEQVESLINSLKIRWNFFRINQVEGLVFNFVLQERNNVKKTS